MEQLLDALEGGATIVTPATGLARHLQVHYTRRRRAAGELTWEAPRIFAWSAWLHSLWEQSVRRGGTAGALNLMSAEQRRLLWVQALTRDDSLVSERAPLRLMLAAWQLCQQWQIGPEELKRLAQSADTNMFCRYYEWYAAHCRSHGLLDPDQAANRLGEDIVAGAIAVPTEVCLAGFLTLTPQQSAFLECLKSQDASVARVPESPPAATARRVECDDFDTELQAAARWARAALDDHGAGHIALVLPDIRRDGARVRRWMLDALAPDWRSPGQAALPVQMADARALTALAPVHAAFLLLDALRLRRLDYRSLGQLLRAPFLSGAGEEAIQRAKLDRWMRERIQQDVALSWLIEVSAEPAPLLSGALARAIDAVAAAGERREAGEWAEFIDRLMAQVGWPGVARRPEDGAWQDVWAALLEDFARAGSVLGPLSFSGAVRGLRLMAEERRLAVPVVGSGVEILGIADLPGHRFDAIRVCGMSVEDWPPPARSNPLVPLEAQRRAGVPQASAAGMASLARQQFDAVQRAAPQVTFSVAARGEEAALVSPFIADLELANEVSDAPAARWADVGVESRAIERLHDDPVPALQPDESVRGGSALLKAQSTCPARAFARFRLGAEEWPVPPFGIDPLTRGNIVHDALEYLYTDIASQAMLAALPDNARAERIRDAADRAVRAHVRGGGFLRVLGRLEADRLRSLLLQMVELDLAREPFVIDSLEGQVEVAIGPLQLVVRHDRIDRLDDGTGLVMDYKTSRQFSPTQWSGERPDEPQLPLYAVESDHIAAIAVVLLNQQGVKFAGVGERDFGVRQIRAASDFDPEAGDNWATLKSAWQQRLVTLAVEFAGGDARIDQDRLNDLNDDFALVLRPFDLAEEDRE